MNHDSLYVYNQQPFGDEEDSIEYGLFQKNKKFNPTTVFVKSCGGQTLIQIKSGNYSEFGTEDNERTTLSEILQNPYSDIVQKLELK